MSSPSSNYQINQMIVDGKLPDNILNEIIKTIIINNKKNIVLKKDIYNWIINEFILNNKNKDLDLIKNKINKLFEPLSLNCYIQSFKNEKMVYYTIVFNLNFIKDDNLNNINIYPCLNMIKNFINDSNENSDKIKIPVKLYDYLMIYISEKKKNDNDFETEYYNIVKFFSDNKINFLLENKTKNSNSKAFYQLIFSKIDTNNENSIKTFSDNNNLITNNTTNFPNLFDNKPSQEPQKFIDYGKIKKNWYNDNVKEDDVKEDVVEENVVINNVKKDDVEENDVINNVKEDNVKENVVIDNVKENDVIDNVKEDDVKKEDDINDEDEIIHEMQENVSFNINNENNNNQTISGVFCQGQMQLSGENEHDNFVISMNGIKDGNKLNLNFSITGLCDENGSPIRIPVKINFPFNKALDNRSVIFSPVSNNF